MSVRVKHTAIGANRIPAVASCCPDKSGLVAFAADRYIALWKPAVCTAGSSKSKLEVTLIKIRRREVASNTCLRVIRSLCLR